MLKFVSNFIYQLVGLFIICVILATIYNIGIDRTLELAQYAWDKFWELVFRIAPQQL